MAKRKPQKKKLSDLSSLGGIMYSTNPDFEFEQGENAQGPVDIKDMTLYVSRDKKGRGGKVATLVEGFEGSDDDLIDLGKYLKQKCGVGGSAKDGEIIVQGDKRDKVADLLREKGYRVKLKGG